MPVLAALDECIATIRKITVFAGIGLEDAAHQHQALTYIHQCCSEIDETLQGIFDGLGDHNDAGSA